MKNNELIEPYRIFFPLGIFAAFIGVGLWAFFKFRWLSFYPMLAHANIMYFSFMWSFIIGFLMTAIPKMTSTYSTNVFELSFSVLLVFLQIVINIRNNIEFSFYIFTLQVLFLIYYLVRRFIVFKKIPFEGFVFIPFAFFQIFLGLILYYTNLIDLHKVYFFVGEAFVCNLIFGLGSRLVPVISRIPNALMPNDILQNTKMNTSLLLAILFNALLIAQAFIVNNLIVDMLKFLLVAYISYSSLSIFKVPTHIGAVPVFIKLSIIIANLVLLFQALGLKSVAISHALYIGSFVMITIMIATRVMLAHGGQLLDYELKSKRVYIVGSLILVSVLSRYMIGANITSNYLIFALVIFCLALSLWLHKFIRIMCNEKK